MASRNRNKPMSATPLSTAAAQPAEHKEPVHVDTPPDRAGGAAGTGPETAGVAAGAPPVDLAATPLGTGLEGSSLAGAAGGLPRRDPGFLPGERVTSGAPPVNLASLRLEEAPTPGASPAAARHVAEAAGHAVPKTSGQLAQEASDFDVDELTGAEIALLRQFLRNGFPGERIVTPAQAREIQGHLGGQSMY